ncbi:hypothetical protein [Helicobacter sp. 12S02634-8]|uniref:hypothetical protein n=1 Tax=Helicobacter sp. 12S02634-8 TaxID=1476199 RepID=UPI001179B6EC|nr:hypothetical protein [Helicobacter sp. 12S02634-8]
MKNIELFDRYTGLIFTELLEEFPLKKWIHIESFTKIPLVNELEHPYENKIFIGTLQWLAEEGYIKMKTPNHYGAECILTGKALALLKSKPKSIQENGKSYGEMLIEMSKIAGGEGFNAVVNAILSKIL